MKITRRDVLKFSSAALLLGGAGYALRDKKASTFPQSRPNVLLVVVDDMCFDALGAAGNPHIHTPTLDRLAREGWYFRNHFVTTSICPVSRASIHTGQYESRHKVNGFRKPLSPEAFAQTYPQLLRASGYFTGHIGKWGIGDGKPFPNDKYDFFEGLRTTSRYMQKVDDDGETVKMHLTDLEYTQSQKFFEMCPVNSPFLFTVAPFAPHVPLVAQKRFLDLYKNKTFPRSTMDTDAEWQKIAHVFDHTYNRGRYNNEIGTEKKYNAYLQKYYALISGVDEMIDKVMKALEANDRLDNTIIIFTSDNGMMLGQHGLCGKNAMFEDSIRTPLIVWYGDAIRKGHIPRKVQDISLNIDIAPTILDYAGVTIPDRMQGISLRPAIELQAKTRSMFYYQHTLRGVPPQCEGVRSEEWKYARYTEKDGREFQLLYHIKEDPLEQRDLSQHAEAQAILKEMREQCAQYAVELV